MNEPHGTLPDLDLAGARCLVVGLAREGTALGRYLAEHGAAVTAVDPACAMLDLARIKPGAERVHWVEGDARGLRLGERFGLIVMTGHAFQTLLSPLDRAACLLAIAAHLAPGGRFVFEPGARIHPRVPHGRPTSPYFPAPFRAEGPSKPHLADPQRPGEALCRSQFIWLWRYKCPYRS